MRATGNLNLFASKLRELLHHPLINLALEWNDERGQLSQAFPAPPCQFRLVTGRAIAVDLAVVAGGGHREPLLSRSGIIGRPRVTRELARGVVGDPVRDLGQL